MGIKKSHKLKNKKILITAGPTWVPIDNVRVISNIATGTTGILLAEKLHTQGAKVTLLLGPQEACCLNKKIRLIRFNFFDELKNIIIKEIKSKRYDALIHSAAVSDYRPKISYRHKVKSGIKRWKINLVPTPKVIDLIRSIDRSLLLVGFKFEQQVTKSALIKKAKALMRHAHLDLAVANSINKNQYRAYIINNNNRIYGPTTTKKGMTERLINLIGEHL